MRTKELAAIATRLVDTATEISKSLEGAFHMRERLLRETRKKQRSAQMDVINQVLGMAGRGFREHVENNLAHSIVREAIKSIDFDVEPGISAYFHANGVTRFTAKAYVLTQAELTKLVDEAIEIGRRS